MIDVGKFLGHQQKKLLDTSRNNRLLNYKLTTKAIETESEWPEVIFSRLVKWGKPLTLLPKTEDLDDEEAALGKLLETANEEEDTYILADEDSIVRDEFRVNFEQEAEVSTEDKSIQTRLDAIRASVAAAKKRELIRIAGKLPTAHQASDLKKRQETIQRDIQRFNRELGANPYYLTLGMLEWIDSRSKAKNLAPLMLIPVELTRKNRFANFKVQYTDEEVEFNDALIEKLREDFDLDISLPSHIHQSNVIGYFEYVADSVNVHGWQVYETSIALSVFASKNIVMHRDLKRESWPATDKPESNPTLSKLLNGGFNRAWEAPYRQSHHIDSLIDPLESWQIDDADSSQLLAIQHVRNGHDLIIQGPPGTGKSQTITNIIAQAIGDGKSILFVAQKETALNVVKGKLDDAGLGHLCLELHRDKTKRATFLEGIQKALEYSQRIPLEQLSAGIQKLNLEQLEMLRDQLNNYSDAVNTPIEGEEMTVFQCFEELIRLEALFQDVDPPFWPSREMFRQKAPSSRQDWLPKIKTLQLLLAEIGIPRNNVFRFCDYSEDSFLAPELIRQTIHRSLSTLTTLKQSAQQLVEHLQIPQPTTPRATASFIHMAQHLLRAPNLSDVAVSSDKWQTRSSEIDTVISALRKLYELRRENNKLLKPEAWTQDVATLQEQIQINSNAFQRFLNLPVKAPDALTHICTAEPPPTLREQMSLLDTISAYQKHQNTVVAKGTLVKELVGDVNWRDGRMDWKYLSNLNNWILGLKQTIAALNLPASFLSYIKEGINFDELRSTIALVEESIQQHETAVADMVKRLKLDQEGQFGKNHSFVTQSFAYQESLLNSWLQNLNQLKDIVDYNRLKADLVAEGFSPVIELGETWSKASQYLVDIVLHTWCSHLIADVSEHNTLIKVFNRVAHEAAIQQFCELDQTSFIANRAYLATSHYESVENMKTVEIPDIEDQLKLLRQQCISKKNKQTIRSIMEQAGGVIQTLKPVFMMSPTSAAKFLPPGKIDFDLVIFDEASQIKPEDALGAILRGSQTVVVGDRHQLPPTDFFSTSTNITEEAGDILDGESILDLFYIAGVPETTLLWHYRSQHHSLIMPSNHAFYGNELVVFPSPKVIDKQLGVHMEYIPDSVYDRGGTRTNIVEARRVAESVMHHAATEPRLSLGVVSLHEAQAQAIEHELDILRSQNRDHEEFFEVENNLLITNLESVQGDEKDVIFISIGYGYSMDGRLTLQFGPISQEGGPRRLNVLTTRARKRCVVFSSIRGRDILDRNPGNPGARFLAEYLDYAETGLIDTYNESNASDYSLESVQQRRERREKLFIILHEKFNLEEIRELCFMLEMDYENVRGETKKAKALDLALHFHRRDSLKQLIEVGKRLRPKLNWDELLPVEPKLTSPQLEGDKADSLVTPATPNWGDSFSTSKNSQSFSKSQMEKEIAEILETNGYPVETNVGPENAAIPIAVMDDSKQRAVLGIEFDDRRYHQARTARDRDRLRPQELEKLQWNIHRIWIIDWYYHKDREVSRLLQVVNSVT